MSILSDVEEDIRRYLAAEDRVNELRSVYDVMCSLDVRSKSKFLLMQLFSESWRATSIGTTSTALPPTWSR